MIRPTLIDLNPVELNYLSFMISLDKRNGSCNAVDDLSTKICVPSETKDMNDKKFNMITRTNDAKTLVKHISYNCKCKLKTTTCNSNQKWNNDGIIANANVRVKNVVRAQNIIAGILVHVFLRVIGI